MTTNPSLLKRGDVLLCSQGTTPGTFLCTSKSGNASATDTQAMVNIPTFGMCNAKANPQTMAQSAAAQGVHVPGQCLPMTVGAWAGGGADPAQVDATAVCHCAYGGVIRRP